MDEKVVTTADALEALMQRTAEEGARRALAAIGLEDAMASNDVRDLRGRLGAFGQAERTGFAPPVHRSNAASSRSVQH